MAVRKRNIMRAFKIHEISGVDRPAQSGATVAIMKRDTSSNKRGDLVTTLTSVVDGHQHGITGEPAREIGSEPWIHVGYATSTGEDYGHDHQITMDDEGNFVVGMANGHYHVIENPEALRTAIGKSAPADPAPPGGNAMTEKQLKARITELKKKLARSQQIIALAGEERTHFDGLSSEYDQDEFLGKSSAGRADDIQKALDADPVVYTTTGGIEIRKSDGRLAEIQARKIDDQDKTLAKLRTQAADSDLRKRAGTLMKNMPGEEDVHVEILRQVEKIEDEEMRKKALQVLKANDAGISKALQTRGSRGDVPVEEGSAEGQLNALAKTLATEKGISFAKAYNQVLDTEKGRELYGQLEVRSASSD